MLKIFKKVKVDKRLNYDMVDLGFCITDEKGNYINPEHLTEEQRKVIFPHLNL